MGFGDFMAQLDAWGVADVLLPFLLIFTLVFAVLTRTKILGENKKNFNVVVALVLGLSVVIPHVMGRYPPGRDIVVIINAAIPNVAAVIVAVLMMLIIIGVTGKEVNMSKSPIGGWFVLASVLIVAFIFGRAAGWFDSPDWLYFLDNPQTQMLIVGILVFALIIHFVTADEEPKGEKGDGFIKNFGKLIGDK